VAGDAGRCRSPGSFDVVFLVAILDEVADREAAMREVHRMLVPGGVLSITEGVVDPHRRPFHEVNRLADDPGIAPRDEFRGRLGYTVNFTRR
jgi:SAM-dependent methyltransferase